jgi:hypothetical protein
LPCHHRINLDASFMLNAAPAHPAAQPLGVSPQRAMYSRMTNSRPAGAALQAQHHWRPRRQRPLDTSQRLHTRKRWPGTGRSA